MADRLDIILFGATGFTGNYCIGELLRLTKIKGRTLTWGIAGRSPDKLKISLLEYQTQTSDDLSTIPIIIADVNDGESMRNMTAMARIIINCCGPYRFYGEPVIKACLDTGTHQVDITGEPHYMENIYSKYNEIARAKGVFIVQACGYDCIPCDLGIIHLQKKFNGTLNSVECYLKLHNKESDMPGSLFNYATLESLVYGIANADELVKLRRKSNSSKVPKLNPRLKSRPTIHKNKELDTYAIPFLGADRSVVLRSQKYLHKEYNIRPAQVKTYQSIPTLLGLIKIAVFGKVCTFLIKYKYGQELLLTHPKLFTGGVFSFEQPPKEKLENITAVLTLCGEGWDKYTSVKEPPNKNVIANVVVQNPAYRLTAVMVTLSAIKVLTESDNLPKRGGVYTPGAAFANTSLFDELQENGLVVEMQSKL